GPDAVRWAGALAATLGLEGGVDPGRVRAVLAGAHPLSGVRLRSDRSTVAGFDLTFSAPKSVSVLYGLGGEGIAREVLAAHHEGVDGAVRYLEQHALTARRQRGDERLLVPTSGFVGASFTHGVSRGWDPHVHTHVVVANLVHADDGRWSCPDARGLRAHCAAASAAYDAHVRAGLGRRLGVHWEPRPGGRAELGGVDQALLGAFSTRAAAIKVHLAERGLQSPRAARVAWAVTRPAKEHSLPDYGELGALWRDKTHSLGVDAADVVHDVTHRRRPVYGPALDEHRYGSALWASADGAARRRDVVAAFGAAAVPGADVGVLERLTDLWVPPSGAGTGSGVREPALALRSVMPSPGVLRTLGPRPIDPQGHHVWKSAANTVEQYCTRWRVDDALSLRTLHSLPTAQLVDHLRMTRAVDEARARLGRATLQVMELDRGR
ncbi:MAG TPA: MobF family relaxase, partial [Acidimicrobiales bacterium]|nr:MobF family relaxase [Acidimicrobiales bacterium]